MHTAFRSCLILILGFFSNLIQAQNIPSGINYQGVARDNGGVELANQSVSIRFTVLSSSANGTVEWQEVQSATTNQFGLFTLSIGSGTDISGNNRISLAQVNWGSGAHFIRVEMDPAGGTSFTEIGTTQMMAVPYAYYAGQAGSGGGGTDDQTITFDPSTGILAIEDGNNVDLSAWSVDLDPTNEFQTMTLNGNELELSDGNTITLPTPASAAGRLPDFVLLDTTATGALTLRDATLADAGRVLRWNGFQWELANPTGVLNVNGRQPDLVTLDTTALGLIQIAQNGALTDQVLQWNGNSWRPATITTGASSIGTLNLVDTTGLSPNQILKWDGNRWLPSADISGGSGSTPDFSTIDTNAFGALRIAQNGALDGQVLKWNGTAWVARDDSVGTGGAVIDRLPDFVTLDTNASGNIVLAQQGATGGQILKWNGTAWVAANDTVGHGIDRLPDFQLLDTTATGAITLSSGVAPNQVLKWDGNAWLLANDATGGGGTELNPDYSTIDTNTLGELQIRPAGNRAILTTNDVGDVVWFNPNANNQLLGTDAVGNLQVFDQSNFIIRSGRATNIDINRRLNVRYDGVTIDTNGTGQLSISAVPLPLINQGGANPGQVLKWTGTAWEPRNDSVGTGSSGVDRLPDFITLDTNAAGDFIIAQNGASNGQILKWNGNRWVAANDSVVANRGLGDLVDVDTNGIVVNQVLKWNGSQWLPASDLSGGAASTPDYTTIDTSNAGELQIAQNGAIAGQVLKWNGTTWEARNDSIGTGGGIDRLPDFSTLDTTTTGLIQISQNGASVNQVLKWNGVAWIPQDDSLGEANLSMGLLNNVDTNGIAVNQVLKWDGSNWLPASDLSGGAASTPDYTTIDTSNAGELQIAQNDAIAGQVLKWNGTTWEARNDSIGTGSGIDRLPDFSTLDTTTTGLIQISQNGAAVNQVLKWNGVAWIPQDDSLGEANLSMGLLNNVDTNGLAMNQVLKWDGTNWIPASDLSGGAASTLDFTTIDTSNTGELQLAQNGAIAGQVLKWNGTAWEARNDSIGTGSGIDRLPDFTTLDTTASGLLRIRPSSTNRALLTTNNVGTVDWFVPSANNQLLGTNGSGDLAVFNQSDFRTFSGRATSIDAQRRVNVRYDGVTIDTTAAGELSINQVPLALLLQGGATPGQTIKWNGMNWVARDDSIGTYLGGEGIDLSGNTFNLGGSINNDIDIDLESGSTLNFTNDGNVVVSSTNFRVNPSSNFQILNSTPGLGRVLTSDAAGNATWQAPASSPWTLSSPDVHFIGGNVGIGLNAPQNLLHVHGGTNSVLQLTNSASGTGSTAGARFLFDNSESLNLVVDNGNFTVDAQGFGATVFEVRDDRVRVTQDLYAERVMYMTSGFNSNLAHNSNELRMTSDRPMSFYPNGGGRSLFLDDGDASFDVQLDLNVVSTSTTLSDALVIASNGVVSKRTLDATAFNGVSAANGLSVISGNVELGGDLSKQTAVNFINNDLTFNTGTNGAGDFIITETSSSTSPQLYTRNTSTGDAAMSFILSAGTSNAVTMGLDNSDNDDFKIINNFAMSTSNELMVIDRSTGELEAALFADLDDDSYFIDPASTTQSFRGLGSMTLGLDFNTAGHIELRPPTGNAWFHIDNPGGELRFSSGGTPGADIHMVVEQNGEVGIGTTDPNCRLHVNGESGEEAFRVQVAGATKIVVNPNGGVSLGTNSATTPVNGLYVSGFTGLGISSPSYQLHVADNINNSFTARIENTNSGTNADGLTIRLAGTASSNDFISFSEVSGTFRGRIAMDPSGGISIIDPSDRRLKQNIKDIEGALEIVSNMRPREYQFILAPGVNQFGFIAQELESVYAQAVSGSPDGDPYTDPMGVDYSTLTPILAAAIQEQQAQIEVLKSQVEELKSQLKKTNSSKTQPQDTYQSLRAEIELIKSKIEQKDKLSGR